MRPAELGSRRDAKFVADTKANGATDEDRMVIHFIFTGDDGEEQC